jgi:uncharacterized phage protein gp47/JayE
MWTQAEISQQIRDTLLTYDPDISLDVGTPERKIVDSVAAVLASIQVDKFVTTYSSDINSKFGADLDDYVGMFGMARQAARVASGYITFSIGNTPAQTAILIPAGTLVSAPATPTQPEISFVTINDSVIATNTNSVEAIVNCLIPGSLGNVATGQITTIVTGVNSQLSNISQVINYSPTTGGIDQESDAQLKTRFLNTVFRNIAGTIDQFLGLTLANSNVIRGTVIGPTSNYSEYVQIPGNGIVNSSNNSAKYIYNTNYYVNSDGTDTAIFYTEGSAGNGTVTGGDYYWVPGGAIINNNPTAELIFNNVLNPAPVGVGAIAGLPTGNLTGVYQWAYTNVYNPGGESSLGSVFPTVATALLNQEATLTIPTESELSAANGLVALRNIYRSSDNGNSWGLVGTLYDNTTTTFTDNNLIPTVSPPNKALISSSVVYLNYQYMSQNSRNYINDANGSSILNKIDIYADGLFEQNASDVLTGPGINFNTDALSKYYYANYTRGYSTAHPSTANSFLQLTWTPLISLPSQIVINGVTYSQGSAIGYNNINQPVPGTVGDYWPVRDNTNLRNSVQAREGIEITPSMAAAINATIFPVNYTFNDVALLTQEIIDQHKQIGQDPLVHIAKYRYFRVYLVVIYDNGFAKATVDQSIAGALTSWFNNTLTFGSIIEPSGILQQVFNTVGVVTAKFANSFDLSNSAYYGIQEVDKDGNPIGLSNDGTSQIILEDIEIPVFYDLGPTGPLQKSVNTWA